MGDIKMTKSVLLSIFILLVVAMSAVAVDATVSAATTFSSTTPAFGSATQVSSNPKADDVADRNILVQSTITLNSSVTAGESITGISVIPEAPFLATDINIVLKTTTPVTIANAGTGILFEARIPEKLDAVNAALKPAAFKVAKVNLLNGATIVGSFDVFMQRKNNLNIKDIDVVVTGVAGASDSKSLDPDDTDDLKDVRPGDKLDVTVNLENKFRSRDNIAVEDIDVSVGVEGSDFDDDDSENLGDLSEDDEDSVNIALEVDEDADKQTATMTITAQGRDENGALHGDAAEANVKVERETHDISVQSMVLTPEITSCSDDSAQLSLKIKNIGRRDENEVAVNVDSKALNFKDRVSNLELDRDDERVKIFNIPLQKNLAAGKYAIQIQTFTNNVDLSNTEVLLVESDCESTVAGAGVATLDLTESTFNLMPGKAASLPVVVKNTGSASADFVVSVVNSDDFLESVSSKTVTLGAGQSSTVFFNLKTQSDLEDGTYSGTVTVKSNGNTVSSDSFTVDVAAEPVAEQTTSSFGQSQILWIILDVFLVIVAIFFVKMIFFGRKNVRMKDIRLQ